MPTPRRAAARRIAIVAALAFAAGAFALAVLVWHFGNFIGSRADRARFGLERAAAVERFTAGVMPDDAGPAVLEPKVESAPPIDPPAPPAATAGAAAPSAPERATPTIGANPVEALRDRRLAVPVQGVERGALVRSYSDARGSRRRHEAIDILAPRNTPVVAVEGGEIARLFNSRHGGLTIYQFDSEKRFIYYYAHLERYASGLEEGQDVRRGQVIGYVGTTGNAPPNTPHLHFAVFKTLQPPRWWEGLPLDPYDVLR
jgi:murein DD-endopeptidase MepM/ murein hydrolase activator NlpD